MPLTHVDPALDLVGAGPAPLTAGAGEGAGCTADRVVALVVQGVVGQVVLRDVVPDVLVRPLHERVELPDAALLVALDVLRVRARRRLLAPDPRDPRVDVRAERLLERGDLLDATAVVAAGPGPLWVRSVVDLHLQAIAVLDLLPDRVRLGEEHAGVDREHARVGRDAH